MEGWFFNTLYIALVVKEAMNEIKLVHTFLSALINLTKKNTRTTPL